MGAEIGGVLYKVQNSLRVMLSYTIPPEEPGKPGVCVLPALWSCAVRIRWW
jgi:hypothetical protein